MDEDFQIELNKKPPRHTQDQFSASETESSEQEASGKVSPNLHFLRFDLSNYIFST